MSNRNEIDSPTPTDTRTPNSAPLSPVLAGATPWVPMGPGQAFKPICFMPGHRGYVAQLRLEPGTSIPRHRHTGQVHAFNLAGKRLLDTGEEVAPGGYVYEPVGNVDTWAQMGEETVVVLIIVEGEVEYLGPEGEVVGRFNAEVMEAAYRRHCEANAIEALDLVL